MLIIGYRGTVDWSKVKSVFKRCTDMPAAEIEKTVALIKKGQSVTISTDFVLHDELKDLGITIKYL
jgi:hypothetical protein